ncbi:MAG: aspartate--ammonia ligase [Oscillospiraceae bacterium]|nr:aspartate--ammonia ligase [Oscillospiraceae bacterium]MDY3065447.1 aspartate--ammonia ligase [Oscillospiraceae bacterium]
MTDCLTPPEHYRPALSLIETEIALKTVKDTFERCLARNLSLTRVSAPLFVRTGTGLNDDLSGTERPVAFDVPSCGAEYQIVHSLAKWKRMALKEYGFALHTGLYTDMNAIRRDEVPDCLHSVYVDQWDWEKIIAPEERSLDTLTEAVNRIMEALTESEAALCLRFPQMKPFLSREVFVVSAQELADRWPKLSPKEREDAICREKKTVFLTGIGGNLREGKPHDMRAPDYDDWDKNGDLLIWYPVLDRAVEVSSMGIRVDADTMRTQLRAAHCEERAALPFHQSLLNGELPQTMGGGIGQSRICMLLLQKAHIGEVQSSVWPDGMRAAYLRAGVPLL